MGFKVCILVKAWNDTPRSTAQGREGNALMYLAISGNIGSGKSTLTRMLAQRYSLRPVYEPYSENPYLEDFYADMKRYSFHSQIYFLSRRLEQHLNLVTGARYVIQDRTVFEDANIFARNLYQQGNMQGRDWETYWGLYQGILPALRVPDLLIHIDASLPTLKHRITLRGRAYEQDIPSAYLSGLNGLYDEWISTFNDCPVVRVNGDALDFVRDPQAFEWVCGRVQAQGFGLPLLR